MNNKNNKTRLIIIIAFGALLITAIYFMMKTYSLSKALSEAETNAASVHKNEKVINFTRVFIEKVLKAEGEVDFETRLQLETAVRALDDEAILQAWQKFTESETEAEAQAEVKNLLTVLVEKFIAR